MPVRPMVRPFLNGPFTFLKCPVTVENTDFPGFRITHVPRRLNTLKWSP